jgi:hypothetical protein
MPKIQLFLLLLMPPRENLLYLCIPQCSVDRKKMGVGVSVVFTGGKSTFIFKSSKYLIRRFIFSLELRMQESNRMQEIVSSFFQCVYFV